jgi:hypothetical protein
MLQCGAPGCAKGWHRQFDDPLELPDGRVLVTLHDAATYITELPKKESAARAWQTAISEPIGVWGAYLSFAFRNPLPASVR